MEGKKIQEVSTVAKVKGTDKLPLSDGSGTPVTATASQLGSFVMSEHVAPLSDKVIPDITSVIIA